MGFMQYLVGMKYLLCKHEMAFGHLISCTPMSGVAADFYYYQLCGSANAWEGYVVINASADHQPIVNDACCMGREQPLPRHIKAAAADSPLTAVAVTG